MIPGDRFDLDLQTLDDVADLEPSINQPFRKLDVNAAHLHLSQTFTREQLFADGVSIQGTLQLAAVDVGAELTALGARVDSLEAGGGGPGGGGLDLPLTEHLTFDPDGTWDIGTVSVRPRDLFLRGNAVVAGTLHLGAVDVGDELTSLGLRVDVLEQGGSGGGLTLPLDQNLTFATDGAYDIGTTSVRARALYLRGNAVIQGTVTSGATTVNGNLNPASTSTYDLGLTSTRWRNLFLAGSANIALSLTAGNTSLGALTVNGDTALNGVVTLSADPVNALEAATKGYVDDLVGDGGLDLPLTQDLTFSPDGAFDIGTLSDRPRDLYLRGSLYADAQVLVGAGTPAAPAVSFAANPSTGLFQLGPNRLAMATSGVARWEFTADGHLVPTTHNAYDFGAPTPRIRNLYVQNSIALNGLLNAGATTLGSLTCNGVATFGNTVTLNRDPIQPLEAVPRRYVDGLISALEARVAALEP